MPKFKSRLRSKGGAITAVAAATIAIVGVWEGKRNTAYKDIVGVWTVCYGETRNVKKGDKHSDATCDAMLADRLVEFEQGNRKCMRNPDAVPDSVYIAGISLAYNIGTGAWCNSTMRKRIDAGDYKGACEALKRFNRAGGKVVKGLVNRRAAEFKICMRDAA